MKSSCYFTGLGALSLITGGIGIVSGQGNLTNTAPAYPHKPIRIVTGAPAGGADLTSRLIGQSIAGPLGQPVIIDNRAGTISGDIVARSTADGYTLLVAGSSFWVEPLFRKTPVDPMRGLVPLSLLVNSPNILVVPLSLPVKSVKDLVDMARAKPGVLNYASGTVGGSPQVAGELFKLMAGVNIVGIPYKGTGAAITDLIGGQIQLMFAAASSVSSHIKADRLRPLAIASAQPSPLFPGLPPVAATVPGYEFTTWTGLLVPRGTPPDIVEKLNAEIKKILVDPAVTRSLAAQDMNPLYSTSEQFTQFLKSDYSKYGRLTKEISAKGGEALVQ